MNSFIFLSKATQILGLSHVLFNSKHDQCRACFEFCFLLLIWSTTAEKILKLLPFFFDLPLLVHMKTEIMVLKLNIIRSRCCLV